MRYPTRVIALMAVLALGVSSRVQAQEHGKPAPEEFTGLKVGTKAPAFTLKDQEGKERSLEDLLHQDRKTALVFYRSASW